MEAWQKKQAKAAEKVKHLDADQIVCRHCGEQSASGSFKGFAHKWGATMHTFIAKKPNQ